LAVEKQMVWIADRRVVAGGSGWSVTPGFSTTENSPRRRKEVVMGIILLVLLLALVLGGLGFAIHVLWWIALVVLVLWLLGFLVRVGEGSSRGRWYRW
jgi:membrane protein YdbS with pleckstrin-like domain